MFGAIGKMLPSSCISFVSQAALQNDIKHHLHLKRKVCAVRGTRQITKSDMLLNSATPTIEVNPETFDVTIAGERIDITPAKEFSLGQLYWFS